MIISFQNRVSLPCLTSIQIRAFRLFFHELLSIPTRFILRTNFLPLVSCLLSIHTSTRLCHWIIVPYCKIEPYFLYLWIIINFYASYLLLERSKDRLNKKFQFLKRKEKEVEIIKEEALACSTPSWKREGSFKRNHSESHPEGWKSRKSAYEREIFRTDNIPLPLPSLGNEAEERRV